VEKRNQKAKMILVIHCLTNSKNRKKLVWVELWQLSMLAVVYVSNWPFPLFIMLLWSEYNYHAL